MISFLICLILFLIVLIYLVFALSYILKCRTRVESVEYILKKSLIREANFILGLSEEETGNKKEKLVMISSALRNTENLKECLIAHSSLSVFMTSLSLNPGSFVEYDMLKKEIATKVDEYNNSIDVFNAKVFNPSVRLLSKMCKVKKIEHIEVPV